MNADRNLLVCPSRAIEARRRNIRAGQHSSGPKQMDYQVRRTVSSLIVPVNLHQTVLYRQVVPAMTIRFMRRGALCRVDGRGGAELVFEALNVRRPRNHGRSERTGVGEFGEKVGEWAGWARFW